MKKILVTVSLENDDAVALAYEDYIRAKQALQRALDNEKVEIKENADSGN